MPMDSLLAFVPSRLSPSARVSPAGAFAFMRPSLSLSLAAFLLSGSAALAQVALPSTGGHYTVSENGKTLGEAQFSVAPVQGGDTLTSSGGMKFDKFSYSFNSTATVDSQGNLVHNQLTGSVHGSKASGNNIQFNTASDPTGRTFNMKINADGKATSDQVDRHRNTVLAPDLDPAAYTLMVHLALAQPKTAWVIIPKQNGILVPADYSLLDDLNGTLNGQQLSVKHTAVALSMQNSIVIELFYTSAGQLLEADLNAQNIHVTLDGFKLANHPKPIAPPPGESPAAQGTNGQPPQGQAPGGQGQQPGQQPYAPQGPPAPPQPPQ